MKIFYWLIAFFFIAMNSSNSQVTRTDSNGVEHIEIMPTFPGGEEGFHHFLDSTMIYPEMAREQGIQGRVWTEFTLDENGKVMNVKVVRGIGGGCDEEAKRVLELMPNWIPASLDGTPVKVKYNFPINFVLDKKKPKKKKS